jgi:hypothetical protein
MSKIVTGKLNPNTNEINCSLFSLFRSWPTKSELRCAYYGRNKAQIFNGAIDSANLKKSTLN